MNNAVERAKDLFVNQILTTSLDANQPNQQIQLNRITKANISRVKNSREERVRRDKWEVVENFSSRTSESSSDSKVSSNLSFRSNDKSENIKYVSILKISMNFHVLLQILLNFFRFRTRML